MLTYLYLAALTIVLAACSTGLRTASTAKDTVRLGERVLQNRVCRMSDGARELWRTDREQDCLMINVDCEAVAACQAARTQ